MMAPIKKRCDYIFSGPVRKYITMLYIFSTGNTDLAQIKLFADKDRSINYIIDIIRKNIDDDNEDRNAGE